MVFRDHGSQKANMSPSNKKGGHWGFDVEAAASWKAEKAIARRFGRSEALIRLDLDDPQSTAIFK